jgi:hypothetical protein
MLEINLEGLNARQKMLADIMWELEEYEDVERFVATLPRREQAECQAIMEMMRMELVECYRTEMGIEDTPEADRVIKGLIDKR